jgi:Protein of unknown function (DUF1822)
MRFALDPVTFSVPLALAAHSQADRFRRNQNHPQKGKQIYLNTLAVYAVNFYLQCLGLETDLEASDSWNPSLHTLMDVADLTVKDYGKLECRPVLPQKNIVIIPPEVWEGRISYIAVRLNESLREATLLGFTPQVRTREFPLAQLQDLDELGRYLQPLHQPEELPYSVRLSQWLENAFEAGWQTLESLLGSDAGNFALAFRSGTLEEQAIVRGAKPIDLGIEIGDRSAILLVELQPEEDDRWGIRVQLHPQPGEPYLPTHVTLALLSSSGETLREVTSESFDNFIQLPRFKCDRGETFSICTRWKNTSVRQDFTV